LSILSEKVPAKPVMFISHATLYENNGLFPACQIIFSVQFEPLTLLFQPCYSTDPAKLTP
jgi:hypothetical protein